MRVTELLSLINEHKCPLIDYVIDRIDPESIKLIKCLFNLNLISLELLFFF